MESTIFTPTVIEKIDNFINKEVYRGVISDFDITDSHDFDRAVEDAEAGRTEFEIEIETMNSYDDEFYDLIAKFSDSYLIDQECDVYTEIYLTLDENAKTLEVAAKIRVVTSYETLDRSEWYVIIDGKAIDVKEYESKYGRRADGYNLTYIQEFDSWNDTSKSLIISLED